jgi:hypothetical protein
MRLRGLVVEEAVLGEEQGEGRVQGKKGAVHSLGGERIALTMRGASAR